MDLSKIEATLSYGRFFIGKRLMIINICFFVSFLFPVITILILITVFAGGMEWSNDILGVLVGGNVFNLLLLGVTLWAIIRNKKIKKQVILWFEDTIATKATVKRLDVVSLKYKPYQVQVSFEIDGEKHHKISAPGSFLGGYHKIFAKYDNKKINILYSPKYDEVLILKQKTKN